MSVFTVNRHHKKPPRPGAVRVYVGRPSVLGNPFAVTNEQAREQVVEQFRRHLWQRIHARDQSVLQELDRLVALSRRGDLELECYCHPKKCHADVIAAAIAWRAKGAIALPATQDKKEGSDRTPTPS